MNNSNIMTVAQCLASQSDNKYIEVIFYMNAVYIPIMFLYGSVMLFQSFFRKNKKLRTK